MKEATSCHKWIKQRRSVLRQGFELAESTVAEYAYRIERIMKELATGQKVVWLEVKGWHKKKKHIITLKGQYRLQRQSRNKTTVTVIDLESGERIEVPFRVLLNSERRKRDLIER